MNTSQTPYLARLLFVVAALLSTAAAEDSLPDLLTGTLDTTAHQSATCHDASPDDD
jgi:hypothetical protein